MPNLLCKWIWAECENVHQSKIKFECVIECQIYYVNKYETESEIIYQSKIRFECVNECQIYYVNECETECEIIKVKENLNVQSKMKPNVKLYIKVKEDLNV